jgi:uncharacterized protein (TIGR00730 family)
MTDTIQSPHSAIQQVCVFCGANSGSNSLYTRAGEAFARMLVARSLSLVYGGGSVGLMGTVARTVLEGGGQVTGIIPRALTTRELAGDNLGEVITVDTMAERKERMLTMADAFVCLPGGLGTMDELFEALTWGQLGIQSKPVGLLNINGYFDALIAWFEHAVAEGFVRPHHRDLLVHAEDPDLLLDRLERHEVPAGLLVWRSSVE